VNKEKTSFMDFAGFLSKKEAKKVKKAISEHRNESAKLDLGK